MFGILYYTLATLILIYEVVTKLKKMKEDRVRFPWDLVTNWIDQLYTRLQSTAVPDLIVGLGRGGAIVAGIISTKYRDDSNHKGQVIPIATLDRFYVKNERIRSTIISGVHNLEVHRKRVLLLNADSYSGATLALASEILQYAEPTEVKTASLLIFDDIPEQFKPDFHGECLPPTKRDRRRHGPRNTVPVLPGPRIFVVLNGLVATGKTSVANSLVKELDCSPIYSDWYWFKHGLHDRATNMNTIVGHHKHMIALCWSAVATGHRVVLDTTSSLREVRDEIQNRALDYGVRLVFVRCRCSETTSMSRILNRKHIGPYDFGTTYEYDRIKNQYQMIDDDELAKRNLIDVDTESLRCNITHVVPGPDRKDIEHEMTRIIDAIRDHYFSRIDAADNS